jgi:hypothetical protein
MSDASSWLCKRCVEPHVTMVCPIDPEIHSPFRCEPDPAETIVKLDGIHRINISSMKQPTVEQLLQKLIGIQIDLTNALTTMAYSFNALAESNHALVQAMIESGDVENGPQDQTL